MKRGVNTVYRYLKNWARAASALLVLSLLSVSTYAWFTANRLVDTNRISTVSGTENLELQVSADGVTFSAESGIAQVNATVSTKLMPVSTADLNTFVYNPFTDSGHATSFTVVSGEEYYYHGRVYIRAVAEGQDLTGRIGLYLDQSQTGGGVLASAASGQLLNAARLGLVLGGNANTSLIFRLSDSQNGAGERDLNTYLGGVQLSEGQVIDGSGGTFRAVQDPARALSDYEVSMNGAVATLPAQPIAYLELNTVYPLDVYFYLEGCDPDCTDSIGLDGADLHLAFYGILSE